VTNRQEIYTIFCLKKKTFVNYIEVYLLVKLRLINSRCKNLFNVFQHTLLQFSVFCELNLSNAYHHLMFWLLSIKATTRLNCFRDFLNPPTYTDVCMNLSWLVSFHSGDYQSFDWQEQKHIELCFCSVSNGNTALKIANIAILFSK